VWQGTVFTNMQPAFCRTLTFADPASVSWAEPYTDVNSGNWFYDAVRWAYGKGIAAYVQTSSTVFGYGNDITRVKAAQALWRFAQVMFWTKSTVPSVSLPYTDISGLSTEQLNALKWCYVYDVMKGDTNTTFTPNGTLSRAQLATIAMRIMKRSNGYFDTNSVSIRLGLDSHFRAQYSTNAAAELAGAVHLSAAAQAFVKRWNINFSVPSHWAITGLPAESAPHSRIIKCPEYGEGNCPSDAEVDTHHFSLYYNFNDVKDMGVGSTNVTLALFGFNACGPGGLTTAGSPVSSRWLSSVMAPDAGIVTTIWIRRAIQHELSHLWGAPDHEPISGQPCIMSGSFNYESDLNNVWDIWCDSCAATMLLYQSTH